MTPQRIQLSRARGYRKPEGAVVVSRPSKWGNPFRFERGKDGEWRVTGNGKVSWSADLKVSWTKVQAAQWAVDEFRTTCPPGSIRARDIQIHLAGKDLACWCPLDQPCHADVLLELANPDGAA